ncbi:MAG: hypothetical protein M5U26_26355 [Planctomycetota bacterium]|nr:hypothetical protein [Planctomycetota bacterium]
MAYGRSGAPWLLPELNARGVPAARARRAARGLARMGYAEALPVLVDALEDDAAYFEIRGELLGLGDGAADPLIKLGLASAREQVRRRATDLLGWLGAEAAGPVGAQALLRGMQDRAPAVALASHVALANLKSEALFPQLLRYVQQASAQDPLRLHAAAVALSQSASREQLPQVLALAASGNVKHREAAAIALGLWAHAAGSEQERIEPVLAGLLEDGASSVQERAAQALGARAERRVPAALEAQGALYQCFSKGRPLVRYAAALALGELAARGKDLEPKLRAPIEQTLRCAKIEEAAGACREALLSVTERVSASIAGPAKPKESDPAEPAKTEEAKTAPPAEEPKTEPSEPSEPATQEPAPAEGGESPSEPAPGGEGSSDGENGASGEAPKEPAAEAAPHEKPANTPAAPAKVGVVAKRHSTIPAGPPSFARQRLEELDNPARPGQAAFSGYVLVR